MLLSSMVINEKIIQQVWLYNNNNKCSSILIIIWDNHPYLFSCAKCFSTSKLCSYFLTSTQLNLSNSSSHSRIMLRKSGSNNFWFSLVAAAWDIETIPCIQDNHKYQRMLPQDWEVHYCLLLFETLLRKECPIKLKFLNYDFHYAVSWKYFLLKNVS